MDDGDGHFLKYLHSPIAQGFATDLSAIAIFS
jgi:hypothetical protein